MPRVPVRSVAVDLCPGGWKPLDQTGGAALPLPTVRRRVTHVRTQRRHGEPPPHQITQRTAGAAHAHTALVGTATAHRLVNLQYHPLPSSPPSSSSVQANCPNGQVLTGVRCAGHHCRYKLLICTAFEPIPCVKGAQGARGGGGASTDLTQFCVTD
jgi:hypothetical protein